MTASQMKCMKGQLVQNLIKIVFELCDEEYNNAFRRTVEFSEVPSYGDYVYLVSKRQVLKGNYQTLGNEGRVVNRNFFRGGGALCQLNTAFNIDFTDAKTIEALESQGWKRYV